MYKVGIFRNKKDIDIQLTPDHIINVTGMIGSGKSTYANQYKNKENHIIISFDYVLSGLEYVWVVYKYKDLWYTNNMYLYISRMPF